MMICPVCRKEYPGGDCPRCHFPEIHILGDLEAGLAQMKPEIDAYRKAYQQQLEIGLIVCHWRDKGGTLVPDEEERVVLGRVSDLQGDVWSERLFARIPEIPELRLRVFVGEREIPVAVPNLHQPLLQQVGIRMTDEDHFAILLRNDQQSTASDPVPLSD